jgi:hypothetical protein
MGHLGKETRAIQNPAFGALLLWAFCSEYYEHHSTHNGPPVSLIFIVLPMVLHEETRKLIDGTNPSSGLRFFADKFTSSQVSQSDAIASLHRRAQMTRNLTLEALRMLLGTGMGAIDLEAAAVIPSKARGLTQQIPQTVQPFVKSARKLGRWTSALTLYEVGSTLRVAF